MTNKISRQRKYQIKKQEEGKCTKCGKPAVENNRNKISQFCQKHLEDSRDAAYRRYHDKNPNAIHRNQQNLSQ